MRSHRVETEYDLSHSAGHFFMVSIVLKLKANKFLYMILDVENDETSVRNSFM